LFALADHLSREDLPLALARHVLAGRHAEDPGQCGRNPRDQDWESVCRSAGHGAGHGQGRNQAILGTEDRLADLTQQARLAPLVGQMSLNPAPIELAGRQVRSSHLVIERVRLRGRGHEPMLADSSYYGWNAERPERVPHANPLAGGPIHVRSTFHSTPRAYFDPGGGAPAPARRLRWRDGVRAGSRLWRRGRGGAAILCASGS